MTNYGTLKLILHFCEQIFIIHKEHQYHQEIFETDTEYQLSISMCLIQIGELSNNLTNDFQKKYSEIPWNHLRCFRNRLAHQYGSIDTELSYYISTVDIKDIYQKICQLTDSFEKEYPEILYTK